MFINLLQNKVNAFEHENITYLNYPIISFVVIVVASLVHENYCQSVCVCVCVCVFYCVVFNCLRLFTLTNVQPESLVVSPLEWTAYQLE